jgi:hypothetical protein
MIGGHLYRKAAKLAKKGQEPLVERKRKSLLCGLCVFAVGFGFSFQGCSLLFIQKGETQNLKAPLETAPQADSQSKALSATPVLKYETQEGDTWEAVALWYFGDLAKARKIARDNGLSVGKPPKKGTVLRIVDPLLFPNPKDLAKKATPTQVAAKKVETRPAKTPGTPSPTVTPVRMPANLAKIPRPKVNRAFAAGESLKYEARALGTLGAYASMSVGRAVTVSGRPCHPITIKANTVFPASAIFAVNDVQSTYIDTSDFITWKFENKVHEGNYKARHKERYDQVKHKVYRIKNDEPEEEFDVQPFTQDILSWLYYFRLLPLEPEKVYLIPIQSRAKNFQLLLSVLKKETVEVPAGKFDCLKVKILIKSGTAFRNDEGDVNFWVTDDPRHLLIKTKFALPIGSVDINLLEAVLPPIQGN